MEFKFDNAVDYEPKAVSHPSYRLSKVIPTNNQNITLGTSVLETQIEIPQKCVNLSKSTLDFQMQYIDSGGTALFPNFLTLGQVYIDSIFLRTREGLDIAQLYNVDLVTRALTPYITPKEQFLEYPSSVGALTAALAQGQTQGFNCFKSNALITTRSLVGNAPPYSGGGMINVAGATAIDGAEQMQEPQYYVQLPVESAGHAGNRYANYSVPLGMICPHSLLSLDKTLYFGQQLILVVRWAQAARVGWDTAAAALTTPTALGGTLSVANIQLKLACEQNPAITDSLVKKVNSEGMSVTIPYIYSYIYSVANGTAQSTHQQRYNRSHGKKLLNLYSFVAATSATANLSTDISNLVSGGVQTGVAASGCDKVLTMNSQLNSVNLQEYVYNEYQNDLYNAQRNIMKGSVISNVRMFNYNRVAIQSWRQGPSCKWIEQDDVIDGIDLDVEQNMQLDYTHPAAFGNALPVREVQVAVVQRTLTIGSGGVISLI